MTAVIKLTLTWVSVFRFLKSGSPPKYPFSASLKRVWSKIIALAVKGWYFFSWIFFRIFLNFFQNFFSEIFFRIFFEITKIEQPKLHVLNGFHAWASNHRTHQVVSSVTDSNCRTISKWELFKFLEHIRGIYSEFFRKRIIE